MLKGNRFLPLLMIVALLPLAGAKAPEPLSGLNMEDFQGTVKKHDANWESNPFIRNGEGPQTKQLNLYGIIRGKSKVLALINGEIVKVGDKIGSSEVVAIETQKVILRNADGLFQISFRGTPNDKT